MTAGITGCWRGDMVALDRGTGEPRIMIPSAPERRVVRIWAKPSFGIMKRRRLEFLQATQCRTRCGTKARRGGMRDKPSPLIRHFVLHFNHLPDNRQEETRPRRRTQSGNPQFKAPCRLRDKDLTDTRNACADRAANLLAGWKTSLAPSGPPGLKSASLPVIYRHEDVDG
jgi:hypothetical protein